MEQPLKVFEDDEGLKTTNICQTILVLRCVNRTLVTFRYRPEADGQAVEKQALRSV
jgi:hypothetical protein